MGNWILGAALGFVGMIGLFLASRVHDATIYYVGLLVFVAAVAAIFAMILRATGQPPREDPLSPAREP